ncbi:MAG: IS3 family transposase [Pseudomonadota bacterium]
MRSAQRQRSPPRRRRRPSWCSCAATTNGLRRRWRSCARVSQGRRHWFTPTGERFLRSVGGETMRAKLAFVAPQAGTHSIRFLCRVFGVARSWYHAWQHARPHSAERAAKRAALVEEIRAIFEISKRRYGAPRIHAELRDRGHRLSKRMVATLMQENGIRPPRRKRKGPITTDSRHSHAIAPNLIDRTFKAAAPDAVWLADISYNPTVEGWLYLAAVKDLATQEIAGWSMSERLKSTLCEGALKMAIRNRRPPPMERGGLIHHSDRGVHYACGDYRQLLTVHGITASMSWKGNWLDNAPMEVRRGARTGGARRGPLFGSLKTDLVHRTRFRTRADARRALFEYIAIFYNRRRRHSSIGYRSPAQARMDMVMERAAQMNSALVQHQGPRSGRRCA